MYVTGVTHPAGAAVVGEGADAEQETCGAVLAGSAALAGGARSVRL